MKHFISLGAGVQSSTMALMAALGEITPMPDAAIFADTQAEPAAVYKWLDWLECQLPFPVYRETAGSLAEESLRERTNQTTGKPYFSTMIPAFVESGKGRGMLHRKCTWDFKIVVIRRKVRELLGASQFGKVRAGLMATQWIGISTDEADRQKPSRDSFIIHRHPFLEDELMMDRAKCIIWMQHHYGIIPPKSACIFCPYHDDAYWISLKRDSPKEFAKAVDYEKKFQKMCANGGADKKPFLHSSLVQLDKVNFKEVHDEPNHFTNECEGMCGV